MSKTNKKSQNKFDKTRVYIAAIIAIGIIALVYMLMGDSRPVIDIPNNVHIERNK